MKQLQLIEESYTCLDKPLLEYVYEVDNYFDDSAESVPCVAL